MQIEPILTVTTPAASNDVVSATILKADLGITGTSEDTYLATLVTQASQIAARWCGRATWGAETLRQTEREVCAEGCLLLLRDLSPSITSVTVDGTALTAPEYELDSAKLHRLDLDDRRMDWHGTKIVIVYTAGFSLPSGAPPDLQRAVLDLCRALRAARTRDPRLRSESVDGVMAESFLDPRAGMESLPPGVAALLAPWRRFQP